MLELRIWLLDIIKSSMHAEPKGILIWHTSYGIQKSRKPICNSCYRILTRHMGQEERITRAVVLYPEL